MNKPALRFSLLLPAMLLSAAALSACHYTIDAQSTDPSPTLFAFPAGIAMDPLGRFLYVSNGNADLRFGGGTLMVIDTERFDCALQAVGLLDAAVALDATAALDPAKAIAPGLDATCARDFGTTRDASAALLASDIKVVRNTIHHDMTNLPTYGCVHDPLDPQVIDCKESPFILGNATVRVGNFAGTMRVRKTGAKRRTLYLAVRGDPSVTWVDVDLDQLLPTPDAFGNLAHPGKLLNCFDNPDRESARDGYDGGVNITTIPPSCDPSHLVQTYECDGRHNCQNMDDSETSTIPAEPFNMLLDEGVHVDGTSFSRLLVSHLSAGQVTLIDLPNRNINIDAQPVVADISPAFFSADTLGRFGAFGLARYGANDASLYYLTSNLTPTISTFRLKSSTSGGTIVPASSFSVSGSFPANADGRELIFAPDQQRAFFTQNSPPSLSVLDTRLGQPQSAGLPANKVIDSVPVCQAASHMVFRQATEAGPLGTDPLLKTRLYLACFISNQIMVVDPDRPRVDETILVGRGPTEIAFNFTGAETPLADRLPTPARHRAYVTQYGESTIGVIDLEPGSPTENRLIARIGLPLPIPQNP